ncbi:MAG: carboxypeptidase regulatory-like domain-containing protein [Planctomycetota bacterium]|nr:MAG: carboxypeptidase regulatory-like domain-containing protein [Planctomycetota bacterium]
MKSNHLLAGLAVVVLGGALWLALALLGTGDSAVLVRGPGPEPAAAEASPDLEHFSGSESRAVAKVTEAVVGAAVETGLAAWDPELGGLIGRVVEEDRTPVAGISVALVQVDANLMLAADWVTLGEPPPQLVIGRTITDEEGRFRLGGAYDSSFQGLGIDLRGPRSTIRVVDTQLHHGEVTDVGDIVLSAGCTIFGRVVDEGGAPVPGARVRIVPSPPGENLTMFLQAGVQDFRADCSVGISKMIVEETGSPVVELPPLVRDHIDDLPIPTTFTNADGEYRFESAPIGDLIQGIDKPAWVGVSRVITTTAGEVELADAVLSAGLTIEGIVVDEQGDPLAGVEVLAGSEFVFGEAAILHPAGRTGADGRFSLRGCPATGAVMACARRNPDEHWVGALEAAGDELEIELESTIAVTVHLIDAAGEPVRGARVELAPGVGRESPMGVLGRFMNLGAEPRDARLVETEAGTYVCDEVTPGRYELTARPKGLAKARQRVELLPGQAAELTLICEAGQGLELTVIDARTGAGIAGARASIVGAGFPFLAAFAVGRTGPDGRVHLGPYSLRKEENGAFGFGLAGRQILVQHPRYADTSVPLDAGVQATQVALVRGGSLHGRILWGSDPPRSVYMLVLENTDGPGGIMEAFLPPRLGRSDMSGAFRFTNLPPGTYELTVFDRFLDQDPLMLLVAQEEPTMVHREDDVQLEPGGRTDVVIDLSPSGRGQTARIEGSVYLDYHPVAGARVRVSGRGPGVSVKTDERGNFETPDFLALGEVYVRVSGDVETPTAVLKNALLHSEALTLVPQRVHRLDLDLQSQPLQVRVTGSGGAPVAGARVQLHSEGGYGGQPSSKTDERGRAELTLIGEGQRDVRVSAEGYADNSVAIDPTAADFGGEVEIELRGAVTCAGLCDLTAFEFLGSGNGAYLQITGPGGGGWKRLDADDLSDDRRATFRVEGLQPGSYEAHLWVNGRQAKAISVELPEGGAEHLLLAFEPVDG